MLGPFVQIEIGNKVDLEQGMTQIQVLQAILNQAVKQLSAATIFLLLLSCSTPFNKLDSKTQTVEFHYISWACECANWATLSDIEKYENGDSLADHCVFVEPADSSLVLPDTLGYNNDIVQFIGQYYIDKGFPKDYVKSGEPVDKAKVFRYTSYKVIKSNYGQSIADQIDSSKYMVDKGLLTGQTKTLNVSYAAIMCTCPQWFETKYTGDTINNIEYFYLEPANSKIIQADTLFIGEYFPVKVSVTGQFYNKKGYPKGYFPAKGDPELSKVFRYDKIKIVQRGQTGVKKNGL